MTKERAESRTLAEIIDSCKKLRDKVPNTFGQYDYQCTDGTIDYYKNRYTDRILKIERMKDNGRG